MSNRRPTPGWARAGAAAFVALSIAYAAPAQAACVGDCDNVGEVAVDNIIKMVNIANAVQPLAVCPNGDGNADGQVTIDDIIVAVQNANNGCPAVTATCGDGVVQPPEECDDGGICIGGSAAGTACTADAECGAEQPGVCEGGSRLAYACATNDQCPGSTCVRCKTFGGDTCAANCTFETSITFTLVPGALVGPAVKPGTSGAKIYNDLLELPLPLSGQETLTIGKERNGQIPGVIKSASVQLPKIPVSTLACACIRGLSVKTCGGTLFTEAGELAGNCSDNIPAPVACPANRPCAYVNGPGNAAAGVIGCSGLEPANVATVHDCNGEAGEPPFPPQIELSGTGPAGSAIVLNSLQISQVTGQCRADFCTDQDPLSTRGDPITLPYSTGTSTGKALNVSDIQGASIPPEGVIAISGAPFSCANLTAVPPTVSGANLAGVFTSCDAATIGDFVATNNLVAQ